MSSWPQSEISVTAVVEAMLERIDSTLAVATGLATTGRTVELSDLQATVGRLCAQVLDLSPDLGLRFRPALVQLQARLSALEALVRDSPAGARA